MKCKECEYLNPEGLSYCQKCNASLYHTEEISTDEINIPVNHLNFKKDQLFGKRYRIVGQIGEGGMGKVFKAMDLELNTTVALKMIRQELMSEVEHIIRFKRELLLTREIIHENVIRIHDLGEIDGIKYISMNYIDGNSLDTLLSSKGKLDIDETISIFNQICKGLKSAHDKNIVHRDLKPQNIMIDKQGKIIILDFGIARSMNAEINTTQTGITLGTPNYMSPEQIQGDRIDITTDIFAIGVLLFKVLTGRIPFAGKSIAEIYHKQMTEKPVLPSSLKPDIPVFLDNIILKCLEIKKENRFQNLDEILIQFAQNNEMADPPKTPSLPVKKTFFNKLYNKKSILMFSVFILIVTLILFFVLIKNDKNEIIKNHITSTPEVTKNDSLLKNLKSIKNSTANFKIDLWLNKEKPIYAIGEEFRVYFKVNQDSYLTLFSLGTSGRIRILFPNYFQKNNHVSAGKIYSIPSKDASYIYQIQGPMGKEFLKAIATKNKLDIVEYNIENSKNIIFTKLKENVSVLTEKILLALKNLKKFEWTEAEKQIIISEL